MTKARDLANAADVLDDVSATELGHLDGVTSAIQTQLNAKQAVVSGVNDTEIGYLDGVTSAIQTQLDAKTAKSTLTTTGDIYYASAANTPARLGIGSTDQILKVTGGVPAWATPASGGITTWSLINSGGTALTSATSITVSGISAKQIIVFVAGASSVNTGVDISVRPNNSTTADDYAGYGLSNYSPTPYYAAGSSVHAQNFNEIAKFRLGYMGNNAGDTVSGSAFIDSADTTGWKRVNVIGGSSVNSDNQIQYAYNGLFKSTSAVTSITIFSGSGNLDAGTVYVYGGN